MASSLVDTLNHGAAAMVGIIFAVLHFWLVSLVLRGSQSRARFVLLALAPPLLVVTLDDIGRVSYALGGPLFRVLI
jgi:hypothetical protein